MSKNFTVTIKEAKKVPSYVNDVCIRPINTGLVEEMAEIVCGNLTIEGLEINKKETKENAVSSK